MIINQINKNSVMYRNFAREAEKKHDYAGKAKWFELYIKSIPFANPTENNMMGCFLNELYMNVTHKTEDAIKSLNYFEKASNADKRNHLYAKNATIMASKCNDYERGRIFWDRLLNYCNLNNDDKYDYAAFCLKNKDFNGWYRYFKYRFKKETSPTKFPVINGKEWDGTQDLKDSTLLACYEQGFGDTILMFGYMERLSKLAKKVVFIVQDQLAELLKHNRFNIEIVSNKEKREIKFDYYIPSMSIPIALKLNENNISAGEGFIQPNLERKKYFNDKYHKGKKEFKIGLSVRGSKTGDTTRDISSSDIQMLDKLNGIELYNFTKDIDSKYYSRFKKNKVIDLTPEFNNFDDTAAAMDNMDIIITTDNVLLNLAGALGKKTYGIFNWNNQFRWFDLTGENVVWLSSVKPFVNNMQNNWKSSMEEVIKEIKKEIRKKNNE